MSKTIEISREQLEHWKKRSLEGRWENVASMIDMVLAAPAVERQEPAAWIDGAPSDPWASEWFIAITTHGERVVLRELPEGYTYDFTTADKTYLMRDRIKKWMQFPDSDFVPFSPPAPVAVVIDERAEFEKSVIGKAERFHPDLSKYGIDGEYKHAQLQYAWDLWQARACLDKVKEMNK